METVPVTLGAVLPGTTGVPPLFGNTEEIHKPAIGSFLQALHGMLDESYGAIKPKKVNEVATEKESPHTQDEVGSPSIVMPAPVPLEVPLSVHPQLQSAVAIANSQDKFSQTDVNVKETNPLAFDAFTTVDSKDLNKNELTKPALTSLVPESIAARISRDVTQTPNEPASFGSSAGPEKNSDAAVIRTPISLRITDAALANSKAPQKVSATKKEKTTHSQKSVYLGDGQKKTAYAAPPAPSTNLVVGTVVTRFVTMPAIVTVTDNQNSPETGKSSAMDDHRSAQSASMFMERTSDTKETLSPSLAKEAERPEAQAAQTQQILSPQRTNNASAEMEMFKLVADAALPSAAETQVTRHSAENKTQLKTEALAVHTKESVPLLGEPLSSVKASILIEKNNFLKQQVLPVAGHESQLQNTKPLTSDSQPVRKIELDVKINHPNSKQAGTSQNANYSIWESNDSFAAPVPPASTTSASFSDDTGRDGNIQPQNIPTFETHTQTSSPALPTKPQAPATMRLDAPPPPPLPDERIQAVRLLERVGQSEMHLGMRTETFGSVQVHTVIRDGQVGLTIGSERGDLKNYLASEVPGLENNLRQHDLHFTDVRFVGQSFSAGGHQYGGAGSQSQSQQQGRWFPQAPAGLLLRSDRLNEMEIASDEIVGLSVHA